MKVTMTIVIDDTANVVQFHTQTDNGKKLSRLESAYLLTKVQAGMIKDGIRESGRDLIVPVSNSIPNITS